MGDEDHQIAETRGESWVVSSFQYVFEQGGGQEQPRLSSQLSFGKRCGQPTLTGIR